MQRKPNGRGVGPSARSASQVARDGETLSPGRIWDTGTKTYRMTGEQIVANGSTHERRIHPRLKLRTKIVFEDEFADGLFYVYSDDISMGGIYLASDIPARIGTLLFLSFQLPPHKKPIRVTAEVVRRSKTGGATEPGMGVRFAGLSESARERLEEFLKYE